jgi:hypothetical protein
MAQKVKVVMIHSFHYRSSESHLYLDHEFYHYLKLYLQAIPSSECPLAGKAMYSHAMSIDFEHEEIYGSHFRTFHTPLRSQQDYIRALHEARRISSEMEQANRDFEVFPYSVFYLFFEQYLHIVKTSFFTLCLPLCKWFILDHVDALSHAIAWTSSDDFPHVFRHSGGSACCMSYTRDSSHDSGRFVGHYVFMGH